MTTIETISIVFTGLSISLAAFYYINTLRNTRRNQELQLETRQAQLFMSVYRDHVSKENLSDWIEMVQVWEWDDYDDFREKYYVPKSLESESKYFAYLGRLEGLGVLVKRGLIDVDLLYDLNYASIIRIWEKFKPVIIENRRQSNLPNLYEDVEYIYDEMVRIRKERRHE